MLIDVLIRIILSLPYILIFYLAYYLCLYLITCTGNKIISIISSFICLIIVDKITLLNEEFLSFIGYVMMMSVFSFWFMIFGTTIINIFSKIDEIKLRKRKEEKKRLRKLSKNPNKKKKTKKKKQKKPKSKSQIKRK